MLFYMNVTARINLSDTRERQPCISTYLICVSITCLSTSLEQDLDKYIKIQLKTL